MRATMLGLAIVMLAVNGPALAHDYRVGAVVIGHPYTHVTSPGALTAAGYASLENHGDIEARLVAASSDAAERVEIHESRIVDGIARMRPIEDGIPIAAGAKVDLAPRSFHLMLFGLRAPFVQGERVKLKLTFEPGGDVDVELAVQPLAASDHAHH